MKKKRSLGEVKKRKVVTMIIMIALISSFFVSTINMQASDMNDWQYRMKLTFNNTVSSVDLTNFPVIVHLDSSNTGFWNHVNSNHSDLRFIDDDGSTELFFEVEKWDYSGKEAYIWVNVSQIDAGSTTDYIYLYYDNPVASPSFYESPSDVWDDNFKGVWHLKDVKDSTLNGNDGTKKGVGEPADTSFGQIDGAQDFDGVNDYIRVPNDPSLNITSEVTIEAWIKKPGFTGNWEIIAAKGNDSIPTRNYGIMIDPSQHPDFSFYNAGWIHHIATSIILQTDTWYHIVGWMDDTNDLVKIYVNGNEVLSESETNSLITNDDNISIGIDHVGASNPFNGTIDEVRISNVARNESWINATYLNGMGKFTIGDTTPDTYITSGPSGTIGYNDVTFGWTGTDDVTPTGSLVYSYKLDGSWSSWTYQTSKTYNDLPNGYYTFKVKSKDEAGNVDLTPATRSFTVQVGDTNPPQTYITSGPSGTIGYNDVTFGWTGTDDVTPTGSLVYSYKLEGYDASWSSWTYQTSKTYNDLPNGYYTFKVKAKDEAGNVDLTPATRSFTVQVGDTNPPQTYITSGPSGTIGYNDVTFGWTGTDDVTPTGNLVYSYKLEGYDASWSSWTYQTSKTYNDLPNGYYTFKVKSKDEAGNVDPTPATRSFTVQVGDTTPPQTYITSGPSGTIGYNDVTFGWTGSDDTTSTANLVYSYKLEGYDASWSSWTYQTSKTYNDLPNGYYTFKVKAKDEAGNVDPTPATRSFTVQVGPFPIVEIERPWKGGYLYIGDRAIIPTFGNTVIIGRITIEVDASSPEYGIDRIEFYIDGILKHIDAVEPYNWLWDETAFGIHVIRARAYDNAGNNNLDSVTVFIINF